MLLLGNCVFAQQMPFIFVPGGPTNVQMIIQDHLGRLWIGGSKDVACFDGSRFYSMREFGMQQAAVRAITEDSEEAIWIGSSVGLYRFQRSILTRVLDSSTTFVAASSGITLAVGAYRGSQQLSLVRIQRNGSEWKTDKIMDVNWPGPVRMDHSGTLLIGHNGGWGEASMNEINAWHGGSPIRLTMHESVKRLGITYVRDRFGCLWWRTSAFTSYQCPGDEERTELPGFSFVGNPNGGINFSEAADGAMIFVNNGTLVMGRPGKFRMVTAAQGFPNVGLSIARMKPESWWNWSR